MMTMENRLNKGIKYDEMKPKPLKKMIMELNQELIMWTPEKTREALFKRADRFFDDNIRNIEESKYAQKWHRNVKRFSKYKKNVGILNLQ